MHARILPCGRAEEWKNGRAETSILPFFRSARRASPAHPRRQVLRLADVVADEADAGFPEVAAVDVDVDGGEEFRRRLRASGGEELQVARDERLSLLPVAGVETQHQELAHRVG